MGTYKSQFSLIFGVDPINLDKQGTKVLKLNFEKSLDDSSNEAESFSEPAQEDLGRGYSPDLELPSFHSLVTYFRMMH